MFLLRELAEQQWAALTARRRDFQGLPFLDVQAVRLSCWAVVEVDRAAGLRAALAGSAVPQAVAWTGVMSCPCCCAPTEDWDHRFGKALPLPQSGSGGALASLRLWESAAERGAPCGKRAGRLFPDWGVSMFMKTSSLDSTARIIVNRPSSAGLGRLRLRTRFANVGPNKCGPTSAQS